MWLDLLTNMWRSVTHVLPGRSFQNFHIVAHISFPSARIPVMVSIGDALSTWTSQERQHGKELFFPWDRHVSSAIIKLVLFVVNLWDLEVDRYHSITEPILRDTLPHKAAGTPPETFFFQYIFFCPLTYTSIFMSIHYLFSSIRI